MLLKREPGYGISLYLFGLRFNVSRQSQTCCNHPVYKQISFRTFQLLANDIRQNAKKIPNDIDLIVGIPRSGMIPAYILGLFLNKKVCSLTEFLSGISPWNGERQVSQQHSENILFVDDSIQSGNSLARVKATLEKYRLAHKAHFSASFLAIYATSQSKSLVDYYFKLVEQPRLFQWNYLNHSIANKCCFDMDGVLCVDPTDEQNDDGEKYRNFILTASPLFIPKYKIHAIVTSRLEKYRHETEIWLKTNNVQYEKLIMLNLNSAAERRKANCHASFKAKVYKEDPCAICFIESNPKQAKEIAQLSGKQVICVETDEYFPGK